MVYIFIVPTVIILAMAMMEIIFTRYRSAKARRSDRKLFYFVIIVILIVYGLLLHFCQPSFDSSLLTGLNI